MSARWRSDREGSDPARVGPALAMPHAVWRGTRNELILATGRQNVALSAVVGVIASSAISILLWRAHYPAWRIVAPLAMFGFMLGAQFGVIRVAERDPTMLDRAFVFLHALSQVYMIGVTTVTGGIYSPVLPVVGASTALPIIFFGRAPVTKGLLAWNLALFVAMASLPRSWLGPGLPHTEYAAVAVIGFVWTAIIVSIFVGRVHAASMIASSTVSALSEERVAVAAEQMCRLQSVGSKVAHELKNPLASVKGLVQLLARGGGDARTRERLEVVQSEIARMETILAEYLSFSRPLEDLKPQPVDLAAVAADAVAVVSGRVEQARLTVELDAQRADITADPRRLKEALLNILANAIEATPAGGTIHVATRPTSEAGAVIDVIDSGRGIKAEDLDRLGTSFFTTRDSGTGLGVVLAQAVVGQHGGTIHYRSAPGRGTRVTITLPASPGPPIVNGLTVARATDAA